MSIECWKLYLLCSFMAQISVFHFSLFAPIYLFICARSASFSLVLALSFVEIVPSIRLHQSALPCWRSHLFETWDQESDY